jgi:hypothetical protein
MKWKSTVALLVVTVGIGAYISLYELKQPTPESRERLSKLVLSLSPETVTQIAIETPAAKTLTLNRGEANSWTLSAPPGARADTSRVSRLLGHTAALMASRVLSGSAQQPLNASDYGLDPPIGRLTLTAEGVSHILLFGERTAVEDNRYVKLTTRPDIFIVPNDLFELADQPGESFRDTTLISVNSVTTEGLTITHPGATLQLSRKDEEWTLTQPMTDRADRNEVTALFNRLGLIKIQRFLETAPEGAFDQPQVEVAVALTNPSKTVTLTFGKTLEETLASAKRSDEPFIYAVNQEDVKSLLKEPGSLRSKDCFDYFTTQVTKVQLTRADGGLTLEKSEDQWRETTQNVALDTNTVETFLDTLGGLQISGFLDVPESEWGAYGLQQPVESIQLWTDESDQPQRVWLGSTLSDSSNRYGRIEGRSAVVELPAAATDLLATTADSLIQTGSSLPQPHTTASPATHQ